MRRQVSILVVDDEEHQRETLQRLLTGSDYSAALAANGEEALAALERGDFQLVLTDLSMPGMSGIELIRRAKSSFPGLDVIVMTAHGTLETAIDAIRTGASDYMLKPLEHEEVLLRIKQVLKTRDLQRRADHLEKENTSLRGEVTVVAESPAMKKLMSEADRVLKTDATVLLGGETGVGKEVLARYIHEKSPRSSGPFVAVNCSAVPENLLESEFFGHEKGAFTGADKRSTGLFERAEGGTLFLDEIGDMDLKLQAKVLRAIEDRKIRRVGGVSDVPVDFRLIAATHRDLKQQVAAGKFREDLFFRLNVVNLRIPPLRERPEDVPKLVEHLVQRHSTSLNVACQGVETSYLETLKGYSYPGNIRELSNIVERALIFMTGKRLTAEQLPAELKKPVSSGSRPVAPPPQAAHSSTVAFTEGRSLNDLLSDVEKNLIEERLAFRNGDVEQVARDLQVSRSTLYSKMAKHGIK